MLGYLNNWNIIHFINKTTCSEEYDEVHQLVLDGIITNMESLVKTGKYCDINAEDPTTLEYYVSNYIYVPFTIQYEITTNLQVSKAGELVVKSEYLSIMKAKTNWYWKQNSNKENFILSTRTIVHPCLDVSIIKDSTDTPGSICNKKSMSIYQKKDFIYL